MSRVLKHLTYHTKCSICGAGIAAERFTGQTHSNGQQFESIEFLCGRVIEWSPNFEASYEKISCPNHESVRKEKQRKAGIAAAINRAVSEFALTDAEKAHVNYCLSYFK